MFNIRSYRKKYISSVCLFSLLLGEYSIFSSPSFSLSPPSRFEPPALLQYDQKKYTIVDNKNTGFIEAFQEDVAFVYLNCLIGQFLKDISRLSNYGVTDRGLQDKLTEIKNARLDKFIASLKENTGVDFTRFAIEKISLEGSVISLPYRRKDNGNMQILRYWITNGDTQEFPDKISMPSGIKDLNITLEDPAEDKSFSVSRTSSADTIVDKEAVIVNVMERAILNSFYRSYYKKYNRISREAKSHFETRNWQAADKAMKDRHNIYHHCLEALIEQLRKIAGEKITDLTLWDKMRGVYLYETKERYEAQDLAMIYFYSVMRIIFAEAALPVEYPDDRLKLGRRRGTIAYFTYSGEISADAEFVSKILGSYNLRSKFRNKRADAIKAAFIINDALRLRYDTVQIRTVKVLRPMLFRNKHAYIFGKIALGGEKTKEAPFVITLSHPSEGIEIDAVLMDKDDINGLITSTRSNLMGDLQNYREIFGFLNSMVTSKPKPSLYKAFGFDHAAKVELMRELRRFLKINKKKFFEAEGTRGRAMKVFTAKSFPFVFKVILDDSAKDTFKGPEHVISQYRKVRETDRIGRMLDYMALHNVMFDRSSFEDGLLEDIVKECGNTVRLEKDKVIFKHIFVQGRTTPLDVYLSDPLIPEEQKRRAMVDFGRCIKELAMGGTFVADLLRKNYGIGKSGKVLLYDYDDVGDISDFNFREIPPARDYNEEMLPIEERVSVAPGDEFPEEYKNALVPVQYKKVFDLHHQDIYTVEFWQQAQRETKSGDYFESMSYPNDARIEDYKAAREKRLDDKIVGRGRILAEDFINKFVDFASAANNKGEAVVLGLDTTWIPGGSGSFPLTNELSRIPEYLQKRGLNNVYFVRGEGDCVATAILKIKETDGRVRFSNIIVLGNMPIINSEEFSNLKGDTAEDSALLIGINPIDFKYISSVPILEMYLLAIALNSGTDPSQLDQDHIVIDADSKHRPRIYVFTPIKPYNVEQFRTIYDLQIKIIKTLA